MKSRGIFPKILAIMVAIVMVVGFYNLYSYLNVEAEVDQKFISNLLIDNSEYGEFSEEKLVQLTQAKEVGKVLSVDLPDEAAMEELQPGIYSAQVTLQLPYNQKIQRTVMVNVRDTLPPVIDSPATLTVTQGSAFPLAEVKVVDQLATTIDKDALEVKGFDPKQVGKQKVQLTATDTSGNTATKEVLVTVEAPEAEPAAKETLEVISEAPAEETATKISDVAAESPESLTAETDESSQLSQATVKNNQEEVAVQEVPAEEPTPAAEAAVLHFAGSTVPFIQYGGASAAPSSGAGAWMGNGSVTDGAPTHFIGHNPGDFSGVMSLGVGSSITVVDGGGNSRTYTVYEVIDVTDDGYNANDLSDDVFPRMLYAGGERISLQTCINDSVNRCILAQ